MSVVWRPQINDKLMRYYLPKITLALSLLTTTAIEASVLYRYTKAGGIQVISSQIPAEYVSKGYEILSSDGRVLKTIPAEPTVEEKERILLERREQQRLALWDKDLLRRYSSINDIESAKQRKLNQIDSDISLRYRNIDKINEEIDHYQALAASQERQGQTVTEETLRKMALLRKERASELAEAKRKTQEQEQAIQTFDADIARFKIIRPEQ